MQLYYNGNMPIDEVVYGIDQELILNAVTKPHMADRWNGDYYQEESGVDYESECHLLYGDEAIYVNINNGNIYILCDDEELKEELLCWLTNYDNIDYINRSIAA